MPDTFSTGCTRYGEEEHNEFLISCLYLQVNA